MAGQRWRYRSAGRENRRRVPRRRRIRAELRVRCHVLHPPDRCALHAGRHSGEVRVAGRRRRRRPGFPHDRRGSRAGSGQPQQHVQRTGQPGHLLDPRARSPRGPGAHQRRMGPAGWIDRCAGRARRRCHLRRIGGQSGLRQRGAVVRLQYQDLHHRAAGAGRSTDRSGRPRRPDLGDQRSAPRRRRSAGPAGRGPGGAVRDRRQRLGPGLRQRQDLLHPRDRCERGDRTGAGEIRECRRPAG